MAVAFSRYVDGTTSSSSATAVVDLSACSAGDLVFVIVSRAATVAVSSYPSGWSSSNLIQSHASTYGVWLFSKILETGQNVSTTFTWAAAAKCLALAGVYTGAAVRSSVKGTFATASGTSVASGSITSTQPWLVQFSSGYSTSSKSYTAQATYPERRDRGGTSPDFWQDFTDTNGGWVSGDSNPSFVYASSASCTYRGGFQIELEEYTYVPPVSSFDPFGMNGFWGM